jgi:hypothetical protein
MTSPAESERVNDLLTMRCTWREDTAWGDWRARIAAGDKSEEDSTVYFLPEIGFKSFDYEKSCGEQDSPA